MIDGSPADFATDEIAQADSVGVESFRGEIAFNPTVRLSPIELLFTSIHEIGHLFGLDHNPSQTSVMHYMDGSNQQMLDSADLAGLAAYHKLRPPHGCSPSLICQ